MESQPDIDPRVLEKIKKCLALSTSDNPNESATALRQAHALMSKYGVSKESITMGDIGEVSVESRTMARNKPAQWEAALASVVGQAFGCKMMIERRMPKKGVKLPKRSQGVINEGGYVYVGLKAQVQIAAYTAEVLLRKCKKARTEWISKNLPGLSTLPGGRRKASQLGNEFALGWVSRIACVVHEFAHPPEVESAIDKYIERQATSQNEANEAPVQSSARGRDAASALAWSAGVVAAADESIHRPVRGAGEKLAIGHASP